MANGIITNGFTISSYIFFRCLLRTQARTNAAAVIMRNIHDRPKPLVKTSLRNNTRHNNPIRIQTISITNSVFLFICNVYCGTHIPYTVSGKVRVRFKSRAHDDLVLACYFNKAV